MSADCTLYTFRDEHGARSTLTLDKFVADFLHDCREDVHAWVQETYESVAGTWPQLGRVQKGNVVRAFAMREALKRGMAPDL